MAAMLAVVATGVFIAGRLRTGRADMPVAGNQPLLSPPLTSSAKDAEADAPILRALRESSAEHLERSKLVVLGLATLDPQHARADDWRYERQLAGSLLPETRLYRMAAQERGVNDVARVMRDLETVLLEASMSDGSDRQSLEHVQRLIARRGLVSNMRIVATAATAGL